MAEPQNSSIDHGLAARAWQRWANKGVQLLIEPGPGGEHALVDVSVAGAAGK